MTRCRCQGPGYCRTHRRHMLPSQRQACASSDEVYRLFADARRASWARKWGAGTWVEWLLIRVGLWRLKRWYQQTTGRGCGCDARKRWLDRISFALWRRLRG